MDSRTLGEYLVYFSHGSHVIPMQKFFYIGIFFFLITLFPTPLLAGSVPAGFSKDQIWFSKDPFFVGDSIFINTLIYNSSPYQFEGIVTLKDATTTIDKRTFTVQGGGSSQVISFPWIVTAGKHDFSALIVSDVFTSGTSSITSASIPATETTKVKRFADYDKNTNGVGDSTEPPPPVRPVAQTKLTPTILTNPLPDNPISLVEYTISNDAPAPVAALALPVVGSVESFRVDQGTKASKNLTNIETRIASQNATTTNALLSSARTHASLGWSMLKNSATEGGLWKTPFDYLKLFIALIGHFFTVNVYAFYVLFLLILYQIVRTLIRIFF